MLPRRLHRTETPADAPAPEAADARRPWQSDPAVQRILRNAGYLTEGDRPRRR